MNKQKNITVKTPFGLTQIGPNTTRFDSPTKTFEKMRVEFEKIAKNGLINVERLRDNGNSYSS